MFVSQGITVHGRGTQYYCSTLLFPSPFCRIIALGPEVDSPSNSLLWCDLWK